MPCSMTQHGLTRVGLEPATSGSGVLGINHQATALPFQILLKLKKKHQRLPKVKVVGSCIEPNGNMYIYAYQSLSSILSRVNFHFMASDLGFISEAWLEFSL